MTTGPDPTIILAVHHAEHIAWALSLLEDWLLHAEPETRQDLTHFCRNTGTNPDYLTDTLGRLAVHLHHHLDTLHPPQAPID